MPQFHCHVWHAIDLPQTSRHPSKISHVVVSRRKVFPGMSCHLLSAKSCESWLADTVAPLLRVRRTCADCTLFAVADAAGVVSSWDVTRSCLATVAQAHDGPASCCCWSQSNSIVSCGHDGVVSFLQARRLLQHMQGYCQGVGC